ncbi:MAG: phytoene/squalene synthase family protein [Ignavibacteria bacterium]|nr:phytoene/squalene synthase family protein [Ignavibacteria bacterium]MBT8384043.1 phytoene/squalene synthase family protein [Ignavibacteria bacterium]MBT8392248.1 phytoene/squalene synthase family protein [Ignavibacteria bacterium]NNJ51755.1 phytoene/squalene synthase family protein [Ignavibacteriaceae bacterium]NNL21801.1 phytoene/squalene synthase family protein [Ignavibacteriaceae bacterium]
MTLEQYSKTSYKLSKKLTVAYSTSFSWGIKVFKPEYRDPIFAIYGFVRVADEIVDTFHDFDKKELLKKFEEDTWNAIENKISTNPVLHAFQETVNNYDIDHKLIVAFLKSMEMDLSNESYDREVYDEYIYGSAEVVGLMCLKVFLDGDKIKYDELEHSARMLGAAFQKVNFLRDIQSDINDRGRIYLPGVHHFDFIDNSNKALLEKEVDVEFKEAFKGIVKLPIAVKLGVYSAYLYYLMLFKKIKRLDVEQLKSKRVRVSNWYKFYLLLKSYLEVKVIKTT